MPFCRYSVLFSLRGLKNVDGENLFKKTVVSYTNNTPHRMLLKIIIISVQKYQASTSYSATTSTKNIG